MKLYNKKGLLSGLFWLAVGISGLVLEIARPSSVKAVFIRDIVLFGAPVRVDNRLRRRLWLHSGRDMDHGRYSLRPDAGPALYN